MATKTNTTSKKSKAVSTKKLKFSKDQYLKWYKDMLLMRKFEEKSGQLYIQQKFGGFCHLYIGQEAVVAGAVVGLFVFSFVFLVDFVDLLPDFGFFNI